MLLLLQHICIYFFKNRVIFDYSQPTNIQIFGWSNQKKKKKCIVFWLIKPVKCDASSAYWLNVGKGLLSGTANPSVWARNPLPIELSPSHCNKCDGSPAPESQLSASELYWSPSPILSAHHALFRNIWVSVSPPVLVCFSLSVPLLPFKQSFKEKTAYLGAFFASQSTHIFKHSFFFLFPQFIYVFFDFNFSNMFPLFLWRTFC